jgi:hypothetical protein
MTAAFLFFAIPTLTALAIATRRSTRTRTLTLTDILGGEIEAHPSGGYHVNLVTVDDAAGVGDEVAAWLERGAL